MPYTPSTQLLPRAILADNKINVIIGVMTIVISVLSATLGWATWRLTNDRRGRSGQLIMLTLKLIFHASRLLKYATIMEFPR